MLELCQYIESTSRYLVQGHIGKANSSWNLALSLLSNLLQQQSQEWQLLVMPTLQKILNQQECQDWVAMADSLQYDLLPQIGCT